MTPSGRIAAAIDVLSAIERTHRPTVEALKDWGTAHRFAGAGDRSAIGPLVHDALRWRASSAFRMGEDTPRALVIGTLAFRWRRPAAAVEGLFSGERHAPEPLTAAERTAIAADRLAEAPAPVRADVPDWIAPSLEAGFGAAWIAEAEALAARAPLDLRTNTLKADREKVLKALERLGARPTPISPLGVRLAPGTGFDRSPNVVREEGYQRGWFEIQDEGSQVCAALAAPAPGEQVLDYCAGAGGKTLALSAALDNRGQVHAYDADPNQLAPIFERLKRAGTRNVQVHRPDADLSALEGRMDRVLVDAPCTGSGTWRRRPDAKWRLSPEAVARRLAEQRTVLDGAARFVRPGGRLVYVTCSVLPEENAAQVAAFLGRDDRFRPVPADGPWDALFGAEVPQPRPEDRGGLTLTPAATGTDGFFLAILERAA